MLDRLNSLFNVSKGRALTVAILCFLGGGVILLLDADLLIFALGAFIYGLIYGCIWLYKFNRDRGLVEQIQVKEEPTQLTITMTSPGSHRLFVPDKHPSDR
jgi:hypothetical protein